MSKGHSTRPPRPEKRAKDATTTTAPADGTPTRAAVVVSVVDSVLARIAQGAHVAEACAESGIDRRRLWEWSEVSPENATRYRNARALQAHALAEQAIQIAEGGDVLSRALRQAIEQAVETLPPELVALVRRNLEGAVVQRDRLRVDTLKWYTSRIAPHLYGERLQVDATVDQRSAVVVLPPRGLTGAALAALPEAEAVVSGMTGASLAPVVAGAVARLRARTADEGES